MERDERSTPLKKLRKAKRFAVLMGRGTTSRCEMELQLVYDPRRKGREKLRLHEKRAQRCQGPDLIQSTGREEGRRVKKIRESVTLRLE